MPYYAFKIVFNLNEYIYKDNDLKCKKFNENNLYK